MQANKQAYVYVTRDQAKEQAEAMYAESSYVTSELISSYAWDTALNFICQNGEHGYQLATTTSPDRANIGTNNKTPTGGYATDCYSNIYDFLGNCWEWTTEYSSDSSSPYVLRGGGYLNNSNYAALRNRTSTSSSLTNLSFRLQLYFK